MLVGTIVGRMLSTLLLLSLYYIIIIKGYVITYITRHMPRKNELFVVSYYYHSSYMCVVYEKVRISKNDFEW